LQFFLRNVLRLLFEDIINTYIHSLDMCDRLVKIEQCVVMLS
jgi:hypothetical protein